MKEMARAHRRDQAAGCARVAEVGSMPSDALAPRPGSEPAYGMDLTILDQQPLQTVATNESRRPGYQNTDLSIPYVQSKTVTVGIATTNLPPQSRIPAICVLISSSR